MSPDALVPAALALPAAGALGVALAGRRPNLREAVTLVASAATAVAVACLVPSVLAGGRPGAEIGTLLPGVPLAFEVEPLGMLFALVASGLWLVTSVYAMGYMRGLGESSQTRFFAFFAASISAALGVAFARNLLTLFLCYELLTLLTYPLVTHHRTPEAMAAGRRYLLYLLSTSIGLLLLAILWTSQLAGTQEMRPGGILAGHVDGPQATVLLLLFAFGTGKAALVPFHRWLPSAMVAPTPVSALLHAVAVVKAGVFTILKVVVYVFGAETLRGSGSELLSHVAAATILFASLVAVTRDDLKARLAYSTVAQLGFIVLAAALATPESLLGGAFHLAAHAAAKITLFFCAGSIYVATHRKRISEMDGLARRMPFTMAAFAIGAAGVIGLPPLAGAWSKWYLLLGAARAGATASVAVIVLGSLLSAAYLVPVVARTVFAPSAEDDGGGIREAPLACVVPACLTALLTIALFALAPAVRHLLLGALGG